MLMTKYQYIAKKKKEFEYKRKRFESWIESLNENPKEYVSYTCSYDGVHDIKRFNCPQCGHSFLYRGIEHGIYVCSYCFCEIEQSDNIYVSELK